LRAQHAFKTTSCHFGRLHCCCGVAEFVDGLPTMMAAGSTSSDPAKAPCCSDADGTAVSDADWDTHNSHHRVRLDNEWIDVLDAAVITEQDRKDDGVEDTRLHGNHDPLLHARKHDMIASLRRLISAQRLPNSFRQFATGQWRL
jgi:hypothetical protein